MKKISMLCISQWPNIKNGEYELIEKIKRTGHRLTVVDYLGNCVETGICKNISNLKDEYDFAISFHYDTPKLINIPTFLWVANPLEFMHLRGDYKNKLFHHIRSYDGFLFNGSEVLKEHIENVVADSDVDVGLRFYPSCSEKSIIGINKNKTVRAKGKRLFYCGVNWEKGIDSDSRSQGLLDYLQEYDIADFYGPEKLEEIFPWDGFKSYKGEIPFDGVSSTNEMNQYAAVLAISSPAHMRSETSSSRVFEGLAAGTPVISDKNKHVQKHFGDNVYYFDGDNDEEKAKSVQMIMDHILQHPEEVHEKIKNAQELLKHNYSFERSLHEIQAYLNKTEGQSIYENNIKLNIHLFHHDPNQQELNRFRQATNIPNIIEACNYVLQKIKGLKINLIIGPGLIVNGIPDQTENINLIHDSIGVEKEEMWDSLRLGEKIEFLAAEVYGAYNTFLTQFDFPHYDHFYLGLTKLLECQSDSLPGIYVGGFFINDLVNPAPKDSGVILRNNTSDTLYKWTQNSLAEHQLGSMIFTADFAKCLKGKYVKRFDVLLPISLVAAAIESDYGVHRGRHITLRVLTGNFHRHYGEYEKAVSRGFWSQHYELVSNYTHELNAFIDAHHKTDTGVKIGNAISGVDLPQMPQVDPAVYRVNNFIERLRPIYRVVRKYGRYVGIKKI